jgi:hypothetical protein
MGKDVIQREGKNEKELMKRSCGKTEIERLGCQRQLT